MTGGSIEENDAALLARSLSGLRVVVTRERDKSVAMAERLVSLGAVPIVAPAIAVVPVEPSQGLDRALANISQYDWVIFTSANGVETVVGRMADLGLGSLLPSKGEIARGLRLAAVGSATAGAMKSRGLRVDYVPEKYVGEEIATGLGSLTGRRVLLPRARVAGAELPSRLAEKGAIVDEIPVYETVSTSFSGSVLCELKRGADVVTFTSGSTARSFCSALAESGDESILTQALIACIGPVTAREVAQLGYTAAIVARTHTENGLIQALVAHYAIVSS